MQLPFSKIKPKTGLKGGKRKEEYLGSSGDLVWSSSIRIPIRKPVFHGSSKGPFGFFDRGASPGQS